MQKSKKMMVSLCGLALSSLFVLNNKAVVHADTVDGSQNNAISWDSDSDAAQNVQNTQKADDNQQNATQTVQNHAETSTVRSSSAASRTTNQSTAVQSPRVANVQDAQKASPVVINNPAGNKVNVHYVNRDGGAIADPNVKDTTIDVTKTGQGSYSVPNGYSLNNPDGKYTISGGAFNGTNLKGNTWTVPAQYKPVKSLTTGNADVDDFLHHYVCMNGDRWDLLAKGVTLGFGRVRDLDRYVNDAQITLDSTYGNSALSTWVKDHDSWQQVESGNTVTNSASFTDTMFNKMWKSAAKNDGYSDKIYTVAEQTEQIITSPAYTSQTLPVAFIDSNNNIVGMVQNYSGKVGTTQNVNLTLPTGYKLADGASLPTSVTFANDTKPLFIKVAPNGQTNAVENPANNTINVNFVDQETHKSVGTAAIDLTKQPQGTNYYQTPQGYVADSGTYDINTATSTKYIGLTAWNATHLGDGEVNLNVSSDAIKQMYDYFGKDAYVMMMTDSYEMPINLYADTGYSHKILSFKDKDAPKWALEISSSAENANFDSHIFSKGVTWQLTPKTSQVVTSRTFTDNYHTISNGTVTVPVHKTNSFSFADNSGNVKSVNGNTVDVVLTKPQPVNSATDTRCHSQATRTIQINFPDGQVPDSYKGIVDKSGKLVQTVHFTRTATEDALTGNILQYGKWTSDNKDHNFIGFEARTLPRIPGYTLSIKPAQA